MTNTKSNATQSPNRHRWTIVKVVVATACLSLAGSPSFAEKREVAEPKVTVQKKPLWSKAPNKVRTSGSGYVCIPSGFGQKGRCVARAGIL